MADSSPQVSLKKIAESAGVSAMTVSRVLRQSPRVSEETRARVLSAARSLGHQPDPHLARMMRLVRGRKSDRVQAVLAVIREVQPKDDLHDPAYQYVRTADIQRRALQHGYHAEEFWLGRDGMTPARLGKVLQARGIEGVIVSPQSSRLLCAEMDFSPFAAATFGYGLKQPSLHRSAGNMTLGIHLATAQLTARGYRRIGLAITKWVDDRAEATYSGAMLHYQQGIPRKDRVPILLLPHNDISRGRSDFTGWVAKHRPDVLISFHTYVGEWLKKMNMKIPGQIGLVVHDWAEDMRGFAGIHHRRDHVAAAAVDLVATQLLQNEHGVPEVPRQILIPPEWIEGATVRPA